MSAAPRARSLSRTVIVATAVAAVGLLAIVSLVTRGAGDSTDGAVVQPPGTPRVVFAEFGLNEDQIYTAPADAPGDRTLHANVPHAPGWGINPGTSAAGPLVAYTLLPADADPTRESPAELWVLNVATDNLMRLARDADLLVPPVFADDGGTLLYRRSEGTRQEIVRVTVDDLTREVVHGEETSFGLFPIGLRGAALLFARLSTEGTDIYEVEPGDEPRFLLHASDEIARDWRISPDGGALSFLAPVTEAERVVYRAQVIALESLEPLKIGVPDGGVDGATTATEQYGPVWTPDGGALTVGQEAFTSAAQPAVVLGLDGTRSELSTPSFGFDVPIAWSTDGRYLAVRSFDGRNSVQPGIQRTVIVDRKGPRIAIEVPSEVIFLGWYAGA
ncbi:MAG: hypothetical protein DWG80_03270 [Chloroflexi bacterium]|nr:hypothetical protein [Chloroflexota bacterium]